MKISHRHILLLLFIVWIVLWFNFLVRDMTKNKYFRDYGILLSTNAMGKASYTYGDRLFEFLKFCAKELPDGASYNLSGVDESSVDFRRAIYYLYPHFKNDEALYVLVFDKPGYAPEGYKIFKELDPSRFILKRSL